jgi:hypothetical protein
MSVLEMRCGGRAYVWNSTLGNNTSSSFCARTSHRSEIAAWRFEKATEGHTLYAAHTKEKTNGSNPQVSN